MGKSPALWRDQEQEDVSFGTSGLKVLSCHNLSSKRNHLPYQIGFCISTRKKASLYPTRYLSNKERKLCVLVLNFGSTLRNIIKLSIYENLQFFQVLHPLSFIFASPKLQMSSFPLMDCVFIYNYTSPLQIIGKNVYIQAIYFILMIFFINSFYFFSHSVL